MVGEAGDHRDARSVRQPSGASFTLPNATKYACASYVNDRAREKKAHGARGVFERRVLRSMQQKLQDPTTMNEIELRYYRAKRDHSKPKDNSRRIDELRGQIDNLAAAIGSGLLNKVSRPGRPSG
jgi:hypothetical protein